MPSYIRTTSGDYLLLKKDIIVVQFLSPTQAATFHFHNCVIKETFWEGSNLTMDIFLKPIKRVLSTSYNNNFEF